MKLSISILALCAALPVYADTQRQLEAHVHGVGALDIAVQDGQVVMAFRAPGADIVGFEHAAETEQDRAAIDAALEDLLTPLDLFAFNASAECRVVNASAELEGGKDHDDHEGHDHKDHDHGDKDHEGHEGHDHKDHDHGDKDHEDHEGHDHKDHDHGDKDHDDHEGHDHKDHDHGDKDHEDHEGHDHKDHAHDDHGHDHDHEAKHTEFHAEYRITCAAPAELNTLSFPYFAKYSGAREVTVQLLGSSGASSYTVEASSPQLDLSGKL